MKNIYKKVLAMLLVAAFVVGLCSSVKVKAERSEDGFATASNPGMPEAAVEMFERRNEALRIDSIVSKETGNIVYFTYDSAGNRISETDGVTTILYEYDDMQRLSAVIKDGVRMEILYDSPYDISPSAFCYEDTLYSLAYDVFGNVEGINDTAGELVAEYSYEGTTVDVVYEKSVQDSMNRMSEEEERIGDINPFRYNGHYYDELSGYYMVNGCCYDAEAGEYIMDEIEPYASSTDPVQIMYDSSMSNSSFGKSLSYSTGWYNSVGELELLARCIYGECIKADDIYAVGWEIRNRKSANWSPFYGSNKTNTFRNLIVNPNMYEAITGNKSQTDGPRNPSITSTNWSRAVWTACALYMTTSRSGFGSYVTKPTGIDKQCYHRAMTMYKDFTGTTASTLKLNGAKIKDVVVVGVNSNVTSSGTLKGYYEGPNYHQKNNIFFTYTDELGTLYNIND